MPLQDDTCLAELALALSLSLEISSKRQLVGVRLRVRTLQAELHEGLFCSPLLHRITASTQHSTAGEQPGTGQGWAQGRGQELATPVLALEPEGFGFAIVWGFGQEPPCDSCVSLSRPRRAPEVPVSAEQGHAAAHPQEGGGEAGEHQHGAVNEQPEKVRRQGEAVLVLGTWIWGQVLIPCSARPQIPSLRASRKD